MSEPDPDLLALARLAKTNDHGELGTPESQANLVRAQMLMSIETCDHCELVTAVIPLAAQRWGVEHLHEPDCASLTG